MAKKTLILIPCHGIWHGRRGNGTNSSAGDSRDEWSLVPFQIEGYDHLCFKDHIVEALKLMENDPDASLIISGGQTKKECGPISEALSYYNLATQLYSNTDVLERIYLEEYARDSFENVLYLICRYYELFRAYPEHIKVVGFEFKRKRFVELHLKQALRFTDCEYFGNSPDPRDTDDKEKYFEDLHKAENKHAVRHFEIDFYGVQSPLHQKRQARDPFKRWNGYLESNPSLAPLLRAISHGHTIDVNNTKFPWQAAI